MSDQSYLSHSLTADHIEKIRQAAMRCGLTNVNCKGPSDVGRGRELRRRLTHTSGSEFIVTKTIDARGFAIRSSVAPEDLGETQHVDGLEAVRTLAADWAARVKNKYQPD